MTLVMTDEEYIEKRGLDAYNRLQGAIEEVESDSITVDMFDPATLTHRVSPETLRRISATFNSSEW